MKQFPVQAADGKLIVRFISVPKKDDKTSLYLGIKPNLNKKLDLDLAKKEYDYHPLQAIIMSKGAGIRLRDGFEDLDVVAGDLIIMGVGSFERLLWAGVEYQIIRTGSVSGFIKKDSKDYPEYAKKQLRDA